MDPTVELSAQDERDWRAERQEEIAAICWQKCEGCNGRGWNGQHWEGYGPGDAEYFVRVTCPHCDGQGQIQLHDPWRVTALYAAADDAREEMGVLCYTRIASALSLAIEGAVSLPWPPTVASQTVKGKIYTITTRGCDCYDAYYRAPVISDQPACKHQVAVWLVKAAEKKMAEEAQFVREERGYE
ncbi:MAG: zinc finger-like domain-containing protein [Zetaproteobacteria bacterium]|nr:zinc finger-like domain-containing protein [Zetaproteobacteria bacterium]